jgi:beta-N-acetylhexosaminidase
VTSGIFAVGIEGPELAAGEREILRSLPPWGVILFRRNIDSAAQVERLGASLRECGVRRLLVDQEGGPVDRLRDLLGPAPSLRKACRDATARRAGAAAGAALARLGFDVDLAPVVDRALEGAGAAILGERCASEDAATVASAAGEFLDGLHSRGIGGCLKHFPGLGRADLDTHQSLPVLPVDPQTEALDLEPFQALMGRAGAVMVSHAAGEDGVPASLSREVATRLLRGRLRFSGAAFSDDLEMGALSSFGSLAERCVAAARAGCDLLFLCRRIEQYPGAVEAVEREVPATRRKQAASRLGRYDRHLDAIARSAGPLPADLTLAAIREELDALSRT